MGKKKIGSIDQTNLGTTVLLLSLIFLDEAMPIIHF